MSSAATHPRPLDDAEANRRLQHVFSTPVQRVLDKLQGVKGGPSEWTAKCPAHADKRNSLSIGTGDDGRALVHCHAGCETKDIVAATGLKMADLMPPKVPAKARIIAEYDYIDEAGALLYQAVRMDPKDFRQRRPDGRGGWIWKMKGVRYVPYRLPKVLEAAQAGGTVFVVEGEKDVHALEKMDLVATTNAGGAGKWRKSYSTALRGAKVVVLPDNDDTGRKHAERIRADIPEAVVAELPGLPEKGDVSDWIAAGGTREKLLELVTQAEAQPRESAGGVVDAREKAKEDAEVLAERCSNLANAERLKRSYGARIRHSSALGWLYWDGTRWARGEKRVRRMAQKIGAMVRQEATLFRDPDTARAMFMWAKQTDGPGIDGMLKEAAVLEGIDADDVDFDADPWAFNCLNGTVDLRTGEIRKHDPTDHITKLCALRYDPKAECPKWMHALARIFEYNGSVLEYFQWAAGYSLSGNTKHQCFFILHGGGSNGKSTVIETMQHTIGDDYSQQLDPEQLLVQKHQGHPTSTAALRGVRFLSAIETNDGRRLDESKIKGWTGGDKIRARFMRQDEFEFRPEFKLFLATNHKPVIRDDSGGMWRRVRLIPFNHNFENDPNKVKDLGEQLKAEAEGILAWLVQGAIRAATTEPELPDAVRAATKEYQGEQDTLGTFIEECCIMGEHESCTKSDLYRGYQAYMSMRCESKKAFGMRLKQRGYEDGPLINNTRSWARISLLDKDLGHS